MATLYIMCGPSGSGKSTWCNRFMNEQLDAGYDNVRYVSRDEIRFSLLEEGEENFTHEKEVFRRFSGTIAQTLVDGYDCIADATHLNEFSRRKLTQTIDMYTTDYEIIYVVCNRSVEVCLEHNSGREGRANVPENVIRNMCRDFRYPSIEEDERVKEIIDI